VGIEVGGLGRGGVGEGDGGSVRGKDVGEGRRG